MGAYLMTAPSWTTSSGPRRRSGRWTKRGRSSRSWRRCRFAMWRSSTASTGTAATSRTREANSSRAQQATVYAEVENFRSNSTKDGYQTTLGTSYQILDKTGQRVAGEPVPRRRRSCAASRRRDFHMQYGVTLPTQIYPGEYRLELTITDQRSGKIGQATLPFKIAADR